MKPVNCVNEHDPDNGSWGDCHSACVASLLELTRDDVPLFYDHRPTEECNQHLDDWLAERGLVEVSMLFDDSCTLPEVLLTQRNVNPGVYYVLGVSSPEKPDTGHSVVCLNDKVVHDPTYGAGECDYQPMTTALGRRWWVTYYVSAVMRGPKLERRVVRGDDGV